MLTLHQFVSTELLTEQTSLLIYLKTLFILTTVTLLAPQGGFVLQDD